MKTMTLEGAMRHMMNYKKYSYKRLTKDALNQDYVGTIPHILLVNDCKISILLKLVDAMGYKILFARNDTELNISDGEFPIQLIAPSEEEVEDPFN